MQPALWLAGAVAATIAVAPPPAAAQDGYRVTSEENFRLAPRGDARILGRVSAGTVVRSEEVDGDWREVTLEGWIWEPSTRRSSNRDFDLVVNRPGGENLRVEPNGTVAARLESGALLQEVERRDGWIRVRRTAWMWGRSLSAVEPAAGSPAEAAEPGFRAVRPDPPVAEGALNRQSVVPGAALMARPSGDTLGQLTSRAGARVVTRADGWARVLVEAWVREGDLAPPDDSALTGVSAAEVRGGGSAYEGRVLRWSLQFIALQSADELRRDLPTGQPYMLARGPLPETGFVYLALTADQARAVAALEPLARLTVLGRVRVARSQYLGNPVLDLIEFVAQPER